MPHELMIIVQTAINAFKPRYLIMISAPEGYVSTVQSDFAKGIRIIISIAFCFVKAVALIPDISKHDPGCDANLLPALPTVFSAT